MKLVPYVHVPPSVREYLDRHRRALGVAWGAYRRAAAKGKVVTLGDLAFEVARWSGYSTSEWQARALLSHAVRNGAFGGVRAVPGKGLVEGEATAPSDERRAS